MRDSGLPVDRDKARILLYDVETSPNIAYVWGKYEQNTVGEFIAERQIISIAWKWLGETEVHCASLPMFPAYQKDPSDNRDLMRKFHDVISAADIVVGHNAKDFDERMLNADFLRHGLKPPPPHRLIDTKTFARHKFRFNSNKLDDLGARLGLGRKMRHQGFALWVGCLRGEPKCWEMMMAYNKKDVILLEKLYLKMRPWMQSHPNVTDYDCNSGCPACGKAKLRPQGYRVYVGGRRPRFQCEDCGKWCSGKKKSDGRWKFQ